MKKSLNEEIDRMKILAGVKTESEVIEEGLKEWLMAGLLMLSTISGVYKWNEDKIDTEQKIEKVIGVEKNALSKMSTDEKVLLVMDLRNKGLIGGTEFVFSSSKDEKSKQIDDKINDENATNLIQKVLNKNALRFGITKDGKLSLI